jgi:hypothetical protein
MRSEVKYGKRYWFLYFWKEAVSRADQPGMLAAARAEAEPLKKSPASQKAQERFTKGALGAQARLIGIYDGLNGNSPGQKLESLGPMPDKKLCDLLTELLRMGFRGVPAALTSKDVRGTDSKADNIISCCSFEQDTMAVEVGWRCEARSFQDLRLQGGTKRQVDVEDRAIQLNMRQPWHPYSQENIRKYLWLRAGGNMDNCFYSAISVGLNFKAVLNFPEMDTDNFPSLPHTAFGEIKAVREWTPAERAARPRFIATVHTTTENNPREFLATKVHAYMFIIKGLVLDTGKAATYYGSATFPEKGVANIALDDIYACFPVVRVFHEKQSASGDWVCGKEIGFTAFIGDPEYLTSPENREARYSERARQRLGEQLHWVGSYPQLPEAAFDCAWAPSGEGWVNPQRNLATRLNDLATNHLVCKIDQLVTFNPG